MKTSKRIFIVLGRLAVVFVYAVPIVWLGLSFAVLSFIGRSGYPALMQWYVTRWPTAFDPVRFGTVCFTPERYAWLTGHLNLLMAGILAALGVYLLISRRVFRILNDSLALSADVLLHMRQAYSGCSRREKGWLGVLFGGIFLYWGYIVLAAAVHPEEMCSYLFFARQGWWITATSYPMPNNHILLNLISGAVDLIPGLPPKLVMRLPTMLSNLFLQAMIFWLFLRWGGYWRAYIVVLGTAFCFLLSYFATHGRGYGMQELCALIAGVAAWQGWCADKQERRRIYAAVFVVSSVAGVYLNPAFLYHVTAIGLMCSYFLWRRKDRDGGGELVKAMLLTGWLSFLLYLPMLLVSGAAGLREDIRVRGSRGLGWLIGRLPDLAYDFKTMVYYGRPGFWMFVGLVLVFGWLYARGKLRGTFYNGFLIYFIATAVSLLCWSLLATQYPWNRTLCYLMLGLFLFFMNACYDLWMSRLGGRKWVMACFLAVKLAGSLRGLYWASFSLDSLPEAGYVRLLKPDLDRLWAMHPVSWQITRSDDFYPMYVSMYLIEHGDKAKVIWSQDKAVGEVIFLPAIYRGNFNRDGYTVWGEGRLTVEGGMGNWMEIDVARRLSGVQK